MRCVVAKGIGQMALLKQERKLKPLVLTIPGYLFSLLFCPFQHVVSKKNMFSLEFYCLEIISIASTKD